ncbi:MAG: hypothetical protein QM622_04670 [Microbacterium sp.]
MTSPAGERLRVVAIADSDSYVKWAGTLIDSVPGIDAQLVFVRTPLTVSAAQEQAALAGTALADPVRIAFTDLVEWLTRARADVVVIAGRGPFVRLIMTAIDQLATRPVVVTGLPGISIPAQRAAVMYRRQADLMVVHSQREQRAFTALAAALGVDLEFGLATLPFARNRGAQLEGGTDLVFAAQAIVPRGQAKRQVMADILCDIARAQPDRRVVVKLRSRRDQGEQETHLERAYYTDLLEGAPSNVVFSYEPMQEALATAEGLLTVSSTAAVEAMAMGVPVIALDTFGIKKANLNTVFVGSGVLGNVEDAVARRFRHPAPEWLAQNYFHDESVATWWARVEELVQLRRAGRLPVRPAPRPWGGALHGAWHRKTVLGDEDRSLSGAIALAVGRPVRKAVLTSRRFRKRGGVHTWDDDTSDLTVTPAPYQDPIRSSSAID